MPLNIFLWINNLFIPIIRQRVLLSLTLVNGEMCFCVTVFVSSWIAQSLALVRGKKTLSNFTTCLHYLIRRNTFLWFSNFFIWQRVLLSIMKLHVKYALMKLIIIKFMINHWSRKSTMNTTKGRIVRTFWHLLTIKVNFITNLLEKKIGWTDGKSTAFQRRDWTKCLLKME